MKRPVSSGYFTVWTGSMPLLVFPADSHRTARELANADDFLRMLRRATVIGKPLLAYGEKVWVGLASNEERSLLQREQASPNPFGGEVHWAWLQPVDQS